MRYDPGVRTWKLRLHPKHAEMLTITSCGVQAPSAQLLELKHGEHHPCKALLNFHQQQRVYSLTLAKGEALS